MSNLFTPGIEGLMSGEIDLDGAVIKAAFVRGYTFSAAHKFVSDLTGAGGVFNGSSAALGSPSVTGGAFSASNTTISTTNNGSNHYVLIYQASAVTGGADVAASAQRLIAWIDTGTGLPLVPGTGSNNLNFDTGASKIFKIG